MWGMAGKFWNFEMEWDTKKIERASDDHAASKYSSRGALCPSFRGLGHTGEAVAGGWCILGGTGNDFLGGVMGRNVWISEITLFIAQSLYPVYGSHSYQPKP